MSSSESGGALDTYPPTSAVIKRKKGNDASMSNMDMFSISAVNGTGETHGYQHSHTSEPFTNQNLINHPTRETDAKSDTSFDPLFDAEPDADGEADSNSPIDGGIANQAPNPHRETSSTVTGLAVPDATSSFLHQQPQHAARSQTSVVAPPRNAPPLFSPENSKTFSPDILMIAAIDGQIMLWDKRANTPGRGVGRLWMSEKTPPWCVSVRICDERFGAAIFDCSHRLAGPQTERRYTLDDAMEQ